MKKIFLILPMLAITNVCFSQNHKASEDGFSLLASAGTMSGGLGILAQYQIRLDIFTFITPFAGTGAEFGTRDLQGVWQGYAFGANIEQGKHHRVFGGITYGTRGVGYETKQNEIINKHVLAGPSLILGYKGIADSGWTWQINVGMAYVRNPEAVNNKYYRGPTAGIGTGYKF